MREAKKAAAGEKKNYHLWLISSLTSLPFFPLFLFRPSFCLSFSKHGTFLFSVASRAIYLGLSHRRLLLLLLPPREDRERALDESSRARLFFRFDRRLDGKQPPSDTLALLLFPRIRGSRSVPSRHLSCIATRGKVGRELESRRPFLFCLRSFAIGPPLANQPLRRRLLLIAEALGSASQSLSLAFRLSDSDRA